MVKVTLARQSGDCYDAEYNSFSGFVYILIYNIARKAGNVDVKKDKQKNQDQKQKGIKVISKEDISYDSSTGTTGTTHCNV